MAAQQLIFELPLDTGIGQTLRSVAGDQVVPIRRWPVFEVVIERDPVARLSALGVLLDLYPPGCATKHGLIPGIYAMYPLVVSPAYEARAQGCRKAFKRGAVPGTNAPGATEHQDHCRVGLQRLLQDGRPLEQGASWSFVWAHVDAFAGMPEHLLVVDHPIVVQVEDYFPAAGRGCRNAGGIVLGGHDWFAEWKGARA